MFRNYVLLGAMACFAYACNGDEDEGDPVRDAGLDAVDVSNDVLPDSAQDAGQDVVVDADAAPEAGPCPSLTGSGISYGAQCDECAGTNCCEPITTCFTDADCQELARCMRNCKLEDGGPGCPGACTSAHPASIGTYSGMSECMSGNCTACSGAL